MMINTTTTTPTISRLLPPEEEVELVTTLDVELTDTPELLFATVDGVLIPPDELVVVGPPEPTGVKRTREFGFIVVLP
jgi:hypothetical protein